MIPLEAPAVPHKQRTRDPVVLKTFLGSFMRLDRLADQLRDHREQAAALRAKLLTVVAHIDSMEANAARRFGRASARYGVLRAEATIAWIDEVQTLLDSDPELLSADPDRWTDPHTRARWECRGPVAAF